MKGLVKKLEKVTAIRERERERERELKGVWCFFRERELKGVWCFYLDFWW